MQVENIMFKKWWMKYNVVYLLNMKSVYVYLNIYIYTTVSWT